MGIPPGLKLTKKNIYSPTILTLYKIQLIFYSGCFNFYFTFSKYKKKKKIVIVIQNVPTEITVSDI
jgi:hypothetical protein